jgi:ornithine cyclodeaminase/alanine dehydrogenase-like protein (mu-crystallin family)
MALFISEKDVDRLVSLSDAISAIAEVFRLSGEGKVVNPPRQCVSLPKGTLRITSAIVPPIRRMAVKVSSTLVFKSNAGRLLILSDSDSGRILAFIEVFQMGALRTGAASGVATQLLARRDASTVGIFGTGRQARTQLLAVASVRKLKRVLAISPTRAHLIAFCDEMEKKIGCPVTPAESPRDAAASDILISATTSREPVIRGSWLRDGTHINAIGSNALDRCELDDKAVNRCVVIAVDNREQAKLECAELVRAAESGSLHWDGILEIGDIAAGRVPGRRDDRSITLFKSLGVAMEDVALASRVYDLAVKHGAGVEVPLTND